MLVLKLNRTNCKWELGQRSEVSQAEAGGGEGAQGQQAGVRVGVGGHRCVHICRGVQREEAPPTRVTLGRDLRNELDGSRQRPSKRREG